MHENRQNMYWADFTERQEKKMADTVQRKIAFENADSAVEFVNRVQQIPFDVDLKARNMRIDAKSLLGVLSICEEKNIEVEAFGTSDEFVELLAEYTA